MTSPEFGTSLNKDAGRVFAPPPPSGPTTLNVSLFPYTPEPAWFVSAVRDAWAKVEPGITLNFCVYDCYQGDPAPTHDVFTYDCIFAAHMRQFCFPIYIDDIGDYFPWATAALRSGPNYWGIPYLGCMQILIYRVGDDVFADPALSVQSLRDILGAADPSAVWPQPGKGMLLDLTGGTTVACAYEQSVMERTNAFPLEPTLPPCPVGLDKQAVEDMQTFREIAGYSQVTHTDPGFDRSTKWNEGVGRAYVGLTENFHTIADANASRFTVIPLSGRPIAQSGIPLYADAVSINAQLDPKKRNAAAKLANLIASIPVLLDAMSPQGQTPQYLVPTRRTLMAQLRRRNPNSGVYHYMSQVIAGDNARAFRLGPDSRTWLDDNKSCIRNTIVGPAPSDAQARPIDETAFQDPAYASTPAGLNRRP